MVYNADISWRMTPLLLECAHKQRRALTDASSVQPRRALTRVSSLDVGLRAWGLGFGVEHDARASMTVEPDACALARCASDACVRPQGLGARREAPPQ